MSEKHLTELPWKTLAKQQKIAKDAGLGKALANYYSAPESDHAGRLAAIEEIKTAAKKLKKEQDGNKEVGNYLDEVIEQAEKTRKAVEALAKTAAKDGAKEQEEDDDAEAAEYKKDLATKLKSALNQVKSRAPGAAEAGAEGQPQLKFMAFVAGKACAVLVARKVGSAAKKLLPEIAGVTGGGKFHKGECIFEKNVHTFVLDQVPAGLARKLGKALLAETGMKFKARVRSTDGSVDLDSDTDTDPDEKIPAAPPLPTAAAPTPSAAPVARSDDMVKFTDRLKVLVPQIKAKPQVMVDAGKPEAKGLNVVASEAGVFAKKNDFAKANELLDLIESLLKADAAKADFDKRFPALKTRAEKAKAADATLAGIAGPLKALTDAFQAVTDKETAKDYVGAVGLLADLGVKITAVENLVAASDAAKNTVDTEWAKLDADLTKASDVNPSTPALTAARAKYLAARSNLSDKYKAKDYVAAAALVAPLKTAVQELFKAAADNDKVAGPKATAAEKSIKDLVKSKKLAGKSNAEKIQLLKDLRGTSAEMTAEFRAAQREVYKTLKLDPAFLKEDKKKRKEIIKALVPDKAAKAEFKAKRKNWSKQTEAGKIAMIKKAVDAQSKVLGIPSPEIVAKNEPRAKNGLITNGYFDPNDGKIYINFDPESSVNDFEKAIDLAFHENSHNYQNELVKKLKDGTLATTDPAYEQTLLFEANDDLQAYVDGDEDFPVYQKQPLEEHAHLNGPKTAKALIKAIR